MKVRREIIKGKMEEEKDYDRDPELAEILGSCLDDPGKARTKVIKKLPNFLRNVVNFLGEFVLFNDCFHEFLIV